MFDSLKNIFQKPVSYKSAVPFSAAELAGPADTNRRSLQQVANWIDDKAFAGSFFNYGVPDFIKGDINKPVGDPFTYTDIMVLLAKKYFDKVNYLEIGVSVGKNFFQMMNALPDASLTGFDIEEINPILEQYLRPRKRTEWSTPAGSVKKNPSSLKTYDRNIAYLSADVWDESGWGQLKGNRYNIVFSDALHTPEAILYEFKMLEKYGLLDDRFVIIWDDLVGKMKNSFFRIIRKYNERYGIKDIYLLEVNGWIGVNEGPHSVGIISNFEF